ncbi:MAG: hypothetical protein QOE28_754, partial [Solirubrobacteraceae bacterium]|nr:hypothetical protein [Solirubrobacteraceae bacterium]
MSTQTEAADSVTTPERTRAGTTVRKLIEGELGELRVLIVLAIIWVIFFLANDRFLSAVNLT